MHTYCDKCEQCLPLAMVTPQLSNIKQMSTTCDAAGARLYPENLPFNTCSPSSATGYHVSGNVNKNCWLVTTLRTLMEVQNAFHAAVLTVLIRSNNIPIPSPRLQSDSNPS